MNFFSTIYFKHGLIAVAVFLSIMLSLIRWLNRYTMHDQEVKIPDIKGKKIEEIEDFFREKKLNYQVIDSFFVKGMAVGSIVETIPPMGTKVKPGRTIYITLNSYSALLLTIPEVEGISKREAQSLLEEAGFQSITIKVVSGPYKDLVIGLETKGGYKLKSQDRLLATTSIVMLVCSGLGEALFSDTIEDIGK